MLDNLHGPCGHVTGPLRLTTLLMDLLPADSVYPFQYKSAECFAPAPAPPFSESEMLFMFLARYDQHHEAALDDLQAALEQGDDAPFPPPVRERIAACHLLSQGPLDPLPPLLRLLSEDKYAAVKRMALSVRNGSYIDPYKRGFGTPYDYTGALYRAIFVDSNLLPLCDCPQETHGTPDEMAWAHVFLALHPASFPNDPGAAARDPRLAPWLAQYRTTKDPLRRGQAAVVIWRLTSRESASKAG